MHPPAEKVLSESFNPNQVDPFSGICFAERMSTQFSRSRPFMLAAITESHTSSGIIWLDASELVQNSRRKATSPGAIFIDILDRTIAHKNIQLAYVRSIEDQPHKFASYDDFLREGPRRPLHFSLNILELNSYVNEDDNSAIVATAMLFETRQMPTDLPYVKQMLQTIPPSKRQAALDDVLILASALPFSEFMYYLLKRGANANSKDEFEYTSLAIAASTRRYENVNILLAAGANPKVDSPSGSAWELAIDRKDATLIGILGKAAKLTPKHVAYRVNTPSKTAL